MRAHEEGRLFLSHFAKALDAKGRLSLPASFRAALGKEESVFLHPCARPSGAGRRRRRVAGRDPGDARRDAGLFGASARICPWRCSGTGEMLKPDPEGRLHLSERLKEAIGLTREAVFVGQGGKFQIWAAEAFAGRLEAARERARALRMAPA